MSKSKISPDRLRERMVAVGHDPEKGGQTWLARETGMKQQGVQSILSGNSGRPRLLREIARAVRTSEAYLLKETDDPTPTEPDVMLLDIVGRVGASTDGEVLQETDHGPFGQIEAPVGASGNEAVVEVSGHSMGIYAPDGSLILYDNRHDPPHDDMLGEVCVVGLPDGRTLVKRLLRGSRRGLFDLESLVGDTMRDQRVGWAAVVQIVVHPRHAKRLRVG